MQTKNIGKGSIKTVCIVWCFLLTGLLAGCADKGKEEEPADPFVITLDGDEITVGCTMQELANKGYEFSDQSGKELIMDESGHTEFVYAAVYDLSIEADANTVYVSIDLLKDMENIASISATNEQETKIPLAECIVNSVAVYNSDNHLDTVKVEGIPFEQLSVESLTEIFGEPTSSTDKSTKWTRGDYNIQLEYNDDGLWYVRTSYTGIY